jgi:hypothetical protein
MPAAPLTSKRFTSRAPGGSVSGKLGSKSSRSQIGSNVVKKESAGDRLLVIVRDSQGNDVTPRSLLASASGETRALPSGADDPLTSMTAVDAAATSASASASGPSGLGAAAAGLNWRPASVRTPLRGPPWPSWRHAVSLRSPERGRGMLEALRGASEHAGTRPQHGSRPFNQSRRGPT